MSFAGRRCHRSNPFTQGSGCLYSGALLQAPESVLVSRSLADSVGRTSLCEGEVG